MISNKVQDNNDTWCRNQNQDAMPTSQIMKQVYYHALKQETNVLEKVTPTKQDNFSISKR